MQDDLSHRQNSQQKRQQQPRQAGYKEKSIKRPISETVNGWERKRTDNEDYQAYNCS